LLLLLPPVLLLPCCQAVLPQVLWRCRWLLLLPLLPLLLVLLH
jgi:hypothetical protein